VTDATSFFIVYFYGLLVGVVLGGPAVCVIYTACCVARTRVASTSVPPLLSTVAWLTGGGVSVGTGWKVAIGSGSSVHVAVGVTLGVTV